MEQPVRDLVLKFERALTNQGEAYHRKAYALHQLAERCIGLEYDHNEHTLQYTFGALGVTDLISIKEFNHQIKVDCTGHAVVEIWLPHIQ